MTVHSDCTGRRSLGRTGIELPVLGLGGAPLGDLFETISEDRARRIVEGAWDGGIRHFDTAPWYGHGLSEHRLGQLLRQKPRDSFLLSTKVGRTYKAATDSSHRTAPWVGGLPFVLAFDYSYDGIMRSYEDSLMRLGLNRVDLLVIHDLEDRYHGSALAGHRQTFEKSGWRAVEELRSSGAVKGIGAGINAKSHIRWFLDRFDLDYLLVAMPYTLLDQSTLDDIFPECKANKVSVIVGSPFASGILATGAVDGAMYDYAPAAAPILERTRQIEAVCAEYEVSLPTAALQFPLGHDVVAAVIPGASRADHVESNLHSMAVSIPDAFWSALKERELIAAHSPLPRGPYKA